MPFAMSDDESAAASEHEVLEVVAPQASTTASTNGGKKDSAKTKRPAAKIIPDAKDEPEEEPEDNGEGEDEDEEDEDGDEVYVVEKILEHMLNDKGQVMFKVKWEGYSKKSDQTWEPEENIAEGASELLKEYYEAVGGEDFVKAGGTKKASTKRGRQSAASTPPVKAKRQKSAAAAVDSESGTPKPTPKWQPPEGSWEEKVIGIDAIEAIPETGQFVVYLHWADGRRSQHPRPMCNKRCPQKMIAFYEAHTSYFKEGGP